MNNKLEEILQEGKLLMVVSENKGHVTVISAQKNLEITVGYIIDSIIQNIEQKRKKFEENTYYDNTEINEILSYNDALDDIKDSIEKGNSIT